MKRLAITLLLLTASLDVGAISKADLIACYLGEPVDVICPDF